MAVIAMTLNDLRGHLPIAGLFKCDFYTVLEQFPICFLYFIIPSDRIKLNLIWKFWAEVSIGDG